jgi:hypothetical protein
MEPLHTAFNSPMLIEDATRSRIIIEVAHLDRSSMHITHGPVPGM